MRTNEISYEDFQSFALEDFGDLIEQAANKNIDVGKTLLRLYETKKDMEVDYVLGAARKWIENELKNAGAKQVIGIVAGLSDVKGKNMPIRATFFPVEGKNVELTIGWKTTLQKPDGSPVKVIAPAVLDGAVTESMWTDRNGETRKDQQLAAINEIRQISSTELIDSLEKMGKIIDANELVKYKQGAVVATRLQIRRIFPASKWVDDEQIPMSIWQKGDKKNEDISGPAFTIFATTSDGATVRCYVSPPGKAAKTVLVPQIEEMCKSAIEETDDPQEQAEYLESMLAYRDVVVAGRLFSVNTERTDRANGSISMAASCVVLLPKERKVKESTKPNPQKTLPAEAPEAPAKPEPENEEPEETETEETETEEQEIDTPEIQALKENIIKVTNFKARKPLKEAERIEVLKTMTMGDMKKFKVNEIKVNGEEKAVDWAIVEELVREMIQ